MCLVLPTFQRAPFGLILQHAPTVVTVEHSNTAHWAKPKSFMPQTPPCGLQNTFWRMDEVYQWSGGRSSQPHPCPFLSPCCLLHPALQALLLRMLEGTGCLSVRKPNFADLSEQGTSGCQLIRGEGEREEKSFLGSTKAPDGQLERAGGWWFCCREALPPPSAASQAGFTGPDEQGSTTNTPQGESCPHFHPFPCSFLVSPWSVPLASSGALLGCWCPVSDAAVTPMNERASARSGLGGAKFKGTGWYRHINKGMVCKQ